jgi:hypothetical protein
MRIEQTMKLNCITPIGMAIVIARPVAAAREHCIIACQPHLTRARRRHDLLLLLLVVAVLLRLLLL